MIMLQALGLRARIVISLALVLIVFIVLTELSVSELVKVAMTRLSEVQAKGIDQASAAAKFESTLLGLRKLVLFYMVFGAAIALLIGSFAITRIIVRPLTQVTRAVEQVSEGKLDVQVPVHGTGEITRLGVAFNRMTATIKEQQTELERRLKRLEESSADLKKVQDRLIRAAKLASVGTLAAGVAHEIGNPIAGLLGLLDAMEHETNEETLGRYRALMKQEIERIDRTIRDLLVYARPNGSAGTEESTKEFTNVEEVFEHVTSLLSAQKLFDSVTLLSDFENGPWTVALTKDDLTQVFVNLLLNSAQAMGGEGKIEVKVERISEWRGGLGAVARKAIRIIFKDNGPGVPEEDADRIFDPFFSRRTEGTGSGLGLAICMAICERSGGEISLAESSEKGSKFTVTLLAG